MENTAEWYYEKLKGNEKPGTVMAAMLCALYDIEVTKSEIMLCNRLIRIFGRFTTYFAIIDMVGSKPEKPEEMYSYLYAICKSKFESAHSDFTIQSREPLTAYIRNLTREIEAMSQDELNPPSPEGLDNDQ